MVENSKNPFEERKQQIERWKLFAVEDIDKGILKKAEKINEIFITDPINFIREFLDAY